MYGISIGKVNKLITTLYEKKKYVIHHENLKLYLSGMKLKKTHCALEFKQYIDFNTQKLKMPLRMTSLNNGKLT